MKTQNEHQSQSIGNELHISVQIYDESLIDQHTYGKDLLAMINEQFDQIYKESQMRKFLLKEIKTHLK